MKYNLQSLGAHAIMDFILNPELDFNMFIRDCKRCPVQMECRHLLKLHLMLHHRINKS